MITTIFAAFFFSYYFVVVANFPMKLKEIYHLPPTKRIKPLDCVTCLSVWSAVILFFCPFVVVQFIAVIFGAGFIGNLIK